MLLHLPFSKTILVFVKELVRVTAEFLGTPKKSGGGKVGKPRESARRFYQFVTDIFIKALSQNGFIHRPRAIFGNFFCLALSSPTRPKLTCPLTFLAPQIAPTHC